MEDYGFTLCKDHFKPEAFEEVLNFSIKWWMLSGAFLVIKIWDCQVVLSATHFLIIHLHEVELTSCTTMWHNLFYRWHGIPCFVTLSGAASSSSQYLGSKLQGIKLKWIAFNWWLNWSKKRLCIFRKWCTHLLCTLQVVNYVRSAGCWNNTFSTASCW